VGSLDHFLARKCRDCLERGVRRFNVANANRQSQQAARNPSDFKSAPGLENRSEQADAADPPPIRLGNRWKSMQAGLFARSISKPNSRTASQRTMSLKSFSPSQARSKVRLSIRSGLNPRGLPRLAAASAGGFLWPGPRRQEFFGTRDDTVNQALRRQAR